jgi:RNA-binding protein
MELSKAQQKKIRAQAQKLKATFQIGKNNITDATISALASGLETHELIKVHLLNNASLTKAEVLDALNAALVPDYSYVIGSQFVLFKQSTNKEKRKISAKL